MTEAPLGGDALLRQGRLPEAERAYRQTLALQPASPGALYGLGLTLKATARPGAALEAFSRAAQLPGCPAEAFLEAGVTAAQLGRPQESQAWIERAAAAHPERFEPHYFLGCLLANAGQHADAVTSLARARAIRPADIDAGKALIFSLRRTARFAQAEAATREWAAAFPADAEAPATLAHIFLEQDRFAEALAEAERAMALAPRSADWLVLSASIHKMLGDFDRAREALRRAAALAPTNPSIYFELSQITRFAADDPVLARMEGLATAAQATPAGVPTSLHFALGKANDDLGRGDKAFAHFAAGNAREARLHRYDEAATLDAFARMQAIFTPAAIAELRGAGVPSALPIFLVGMPRSGSTLLEQILVSHPGVAAAGEVAYLPQALSAALPRSSSTDLEELTRDTLPEIARHYLARIAPLAGGRGHVTDKLLANALMVGVIHLAMPNAKIVHCVRDPVDTCLSGFMNSFGDRMPFTNDLGTIGRYHRALSGLMAHWRRVLPPDAFLDVRYEDVVADLEGQARRLTQYCGLEWDARCIAFHQTRRPVKTASVAQVREPIYGSAVNRWRRYEKHLKPLLAALGDLAP